MLFFVGHGPSSTQLMRFFVLSEELWSKWVFDVCVEREDLENMSIFICVERESLEHMKR